MLCRFRNLDLWLIISFKLIANETETDSDLSSISSKASEKLGDAAIRIVKLGDPRYGRPPSGEPPQTRSKRGQRDELENALLQPEPKKPKARHSRKRAATPKFQDPDTEDDGRAVTPAISITSTAAIGEVLERRPPGRPRKDGKLKADLLAGLAHSIVMGGVRLPNNIVKNPLPIRPPAIPQDPDPEILEDMRLILATPPPADESRNSNSEGASVTTTVAASESSKSSSSRK